MEGERFGDFTLVKHVADGGMADIYLAVQHTATGAMRFVTVKKIREHLLDDPQYLEFFVTESRISLKCSHPNLPQIYQMGQIDGIAYLAMEYIEGCTLLELLRASVIEATPLSGRSVITVALGITAALEYAHALRDVDGTPLGIVHRDVTPQNIMITDLGHIKLIDFGIVRSTLQRHQTAIGIVKGKYAYLAPEQLDVSIPIDQRTDIFALGIVLWEALAGRPLFQDRRDAQTVTNVKTLPVPQLSELRPDVPADLCAIIMMALERDPDKRFQNATELMIALEYVAETCALLPSATWLRNECQELCGIRKRPVVTPEMLSPPQADWPVDQNGFATGSRVIESPPSEIHTGTMEISPADALPCDDTDPPVFYEPQKRDVAASTGDPDLPGDDEHLRANTDKPRLERDPALLYFLDRAGTQS